MIPGHSRHAWMSTSTRTLLVTLLTSGCTGYISTPVPPSANSPAMIDCPLLGPKIPRSACPGVRLNNVALTCGGTGKVPVTITTTPGGATRFAGTLADGSVATGAATPIDGRCFDGFTVQIGITFGVLYTADQGLETTGPTAGSACIVRSRADFTQYVTLDPILVHPGVEDWIKDKVHQALDTRLIAAFFQTSGAPALPGRCVRWRPL